LRVGGGRVVVVAYRLLAAEEGQHRADSLHTAERGQTLFEARAEPLELVVDGAVAKAPQHGEAGGSRERVPGERPRLVDVARGREPLHHLGAPAEGGEREAAPGDLAEDRQVGEPA